MTRPHKFTVTSDFDAMKNDDRATVSFSIPNGTVIPAGGSIVLQSSAVTVGQRNATLRAQGTSSKYPGRWVLGTTYNTLVTVSSTFGTFDIVVACVVERISPTQVRAWCDINLGQGFPVATIVGSQTITFEVNTFLSPFEQTS